MLNKLNNIIRGWANYVWESPEVEKLAKKRALECSDCKEAEWGLIPAFMEDDVKEIKGLKCGLCDCPLSTLLRSPDEKCKIGKW